MALTLSRYFISVVAPAMYMTVLGGNFERLPSALVGKGMEKLSSKLVPSAMAGGTSVTEVDTIFSVFAPIGSPRSQNVVITRPSS